MANSNSIRAGRAFVEVFTDNSKLVTGLRAAEAKVKAFGAKIRNIGAALTAVATENIVLLYFQGVMKIACHDKFG